MGKAYSQDLRDRVLDAVDKEGMSRRGAADRFGIGESSAIRWFRRLIEVGSRTPVGTGDIGLPSFRRTGRSLKRPWRSSPI